MAGHPEIKSLDGGSSGVSDRLMVGHPGERERSDARPRDRCPDRDLRGLPCREPGAPAIFGDVSDAPPAPTPTHLHRWLRRAVDVRPDEVRAMVTAFAYFFFVLSGYFVLRPIRDAVAAASGVSKLPWLFT